MQDTPQTEQDTTQNLEDGTPKVTEPSLAKTEPSPAETPKTLSMEEAETLAQLARMDAGRAQKTAEQERDVAKAQLAAKESEVVGVTEEMATLETKIADLTSGDPARFDAVKELKVTRTERLTLRAREQAQEAKEQFHAAKLAKADDSERETSINEVAASYNGADAKQLKSLCDIFRASSEEDIKKVAEILWAKKPTGTPPVVPVSTKTSGGVDNTDDLSPKEKIERGIAEKQKK